MKALLFPTGALLLSAFILWATFRGVVKISNMVAEFLDKLNAPIWIEYIIVSLTSVCLVVVVTVVFVIIMACYITMTNSIAYKGV